MGTFFSIFFSFLRKVDLFDREFSPSEIKSLALLYTRMMSSK